MEFLCLSFELTTNTSGRIINNQICTVWLVPCNIRPRLFISPHERWIVQSRQINQISMTRLLDRELCTIFRCVIPVVFYAKLGGGISSWQARSRWKFRICTTTNALILNSFPHYIFLWPEDGPQWPKHVVASIINRIKDSCVLTYPPLPNGLVWVNCGVIEL